MPYFSKEEVIFMFFFPGIYQLKNERIGWLMEVKLAVEILVKMLHQIIIIGTKPLIAKTANIILFLTGNNDCVGFF